MHTNNFSVKKLLLCPIEKIDWSQIVDFTTLLSMVEMHFKKEFQEKSIMHI